MLFNETYGQIAYEAYAAALGIAIPWSALTATEKTAWQAAANSVRPK